MRVAIMGSGGLGGMLGGLQARAGMEVSFIARGANLLALQDHGLTVQLNDGDFHVDVRATEDSDDIGPVDLLWFCVKTYDIEAAARQVLPLIGPDTMILPLQNGVEAAEQIAAAVGRQHVLGAVSLGGATLVSPGVVSAKGLRRQIALGELDGGISPRLRRLAEAMHDTGIDIKLQENIRREIWDKWVLACATLGLCALMRLPMAPILAQEAPARLALEVMREATKVADARGIELPDDTPDRWLAYMHERVAANPGLAGSMYFDVIEGRRLEVEAINGAAVRFGAETGVPTPLNFAVYAALLPYANGAPAAIRP
jgi:2-dehydropantoate 2-reductase